jgi:hypothetical protein
VGGASLEMCRGRKTEYLDIPLKDSIKGWRLECFIVENHGKSLPPRSGRQSDVRTPSWIESPTDLEITEAKVLLAEICLLKERGLTAEAMVADFVFKNIQPLKDRAYPGYLYSGVTDSTRVTNKRIPAVDLVSWLEMILRGKVSNIGAPVAYSAWSLPPSKPFFNFVSNPPIGDSGLGLRVRPFLEDIKVLVASLGDLPNDERQVHFEMPTSPGDAEISVMLDMLAGHSSDSVPTETMAVATIPELEKTVDTRSLRVLARNVSARLVIQLHLPRGRKRKRNGFGECRVWTRMLALLLLLLKKYRWKSLLELNPMGVTLLMLNPMGVTLPKLNPMGVTLPELIPMGDPARAKPNGCDPTPSFVHIVDEDEEEEEEVPLIWKNSRRYRVSGGNSDIPSPALSALVGLQELSIANFDQALEDVVLEDMLSEPADGDMMDVCSNTPDVGLEVSRAASRASSTLEGGLQSQEVGQGRSIPMEVTKSPSALEVAVAENPVLKGGAGGCPATKGIARNDPARVGSASCNPAPEGVRAGSPSHTSMDVHVGSSPPHSGGIIATHASNEEVALEVGTPDARVLMPASGVELIPGDILQIAPVDIPSSSHHLAPRDLGFPSFFSNLQVTWLFLFWQYSWQITIFVLICF